MISHTVRVNVYDGTIRVDLPGDDDTAAWDDLTGPDGGVFNGTTIEPWREDEEGMDRADTALAEFGFERVGPWSDQEYPTATIRRARGTQVKEPDKESILSRQHYIHTGRFLTVAESEAQRRALRERAEQGDLSLRQLAEEFRVSRQAVLSVAGDLLDKWDV